MYFESLLYLSFRGSASVAKYCAKKLPPTTTLIALQNGKIILEKGAAKLPPGFVFFSLNFQLLSEYFHRRC